MDTYKGKYQVSYVSGIPMHSGIPENRLEVLADFTWKPDDLFIVSYPKSGSTWTQHIVKQMKNNGIDDGEKLHSSIPMIEYPRYDSIIKDLPSPRTFKSHLLYKYMPGGEPAKSPAKYIYVARNPKDTAVSQYHHTRNVTDFEFTGDWNVFFEYFISGKAVGGSWFDHVLGWWKHKDCNNILFLNYEDMHEDLLGEVEKMSTFLDLDLKQSTVEKVIAASTFRAMKSIEYSWSDLERNPGSDPFLRKGMVGDWRNYFTPKQSQQFDTIYKDLMSNTGLDFKF